MPRFWVDTDEIYPAYFIRNADELDEFDSIIELTDEEVIIVNEGWEAWGRAQNLLSAKYTEIERKEEEKRDAENLVALKQHNREREERNRLKKQKRREFAERRKRFNSKEEYLAAKARGEVR
jgi:hypothetical protein